MQSRQPIGDRKAIDVGEADVEQEDVRPLTSGEGERRLAIGCLADDREALGLQKLTRLEAKGGMVVDDQDGWHTQMVAARPDLAIRASPSMGVVPAPMFGRSAAVTFGFLSRAAVEGV